MAVLSMYISQVRKQNRKDDAKVEYKAKGNIKISFQMDPFQMDIIIVWLHVRKQETHYLRSYKGSDQHP